MKKLLIIGLILIASSAQAARVYAPRTLTWTCPTTRTDGSPFSCVTDAAGYDIEVTKPTLAATIVEVGPTDVSLVVSADPNNTAYRIRVCDKAGECSVWSNSVKKPVGPSKVTLEI